MREDFKPLDMREDTAGSDKAVAASGTAKREVAGEAGQFSSSRNSEAGVLAGDSEGLDRGNKRPTGYAPAAAVEQQDGSNARSFNQIASNKENTTVSESKYKSNEGQKGDKNDRKVCIRLIDCGDRDGDSESSESHGSNRDGSGGVGVSAHRTSDPGAGRSRATETETETEAAEFDCHSEGLQRQLARSNEQQLLVSQLVEVMLYSASLALSRN
jgi:hypothetical protein